MKQETDALKFNTRSTSRKVDLKEGIRVYIYIGISIYIYIYRN